MKKLALCGMCDVAFWSFEFLVAGGIAAGAYDEVLFADDACASMPFGVRVVDFNGLLRECAIHDVEVAVCFDEPSARRTAARKVRDAGLKLATLVDPAARISPRASIGAGCIVGGNSFVGHGSKLGECILAMDAHISFDCVVADCCVLMPNSTLCRSASIGACSLVSSGAVVGEGAVVAPGTVMPPREVIVDDGNRQ